MKKIIMIVVVFVCFSVIVFSKSSVENLLLGKRAYLLSNYGEAIEFFDKVITTEPGSAQAYACRGKAKYQIQDQTAVDDFKKAVELNHSLADAYQGLSIVEFDLGHYPGCLYAAEKALENSGAWSFSKEGRRKIEKSIKDIKNVIDGIKLNKKAGPVTLAGYSAKARICLIIKDYLAGEKYCSKAIELEPGNAYYYLVRGICRRYNGNLIDSVRDLSKAIELEPKNGEAYYYRGVSRNAMRDKAGAIKDFKEADKLGIDAASSIAGVERSLQRRGSLYNALNLE